MFDLHARMKPRGESTDPGRLANVSRNPQRPLSIKLLALVLPSSTPLHAQRKARCRYQMYFLDLYLQLEKSINPIFLHHSEKLITLLDPTSTISPTLIRRRKKLLIFIINAYNSIYIANGSCNIFMAVFNLI